MFGLNPVSLLVGVLFGAVTSFYAKEKGRNPYLWFFIGVLIKFFALVILFFMQSESKSEGEGRKLCPHCSLVNSEGSQVCQHCQKSTTIIDVTPSS